MAAVTAAVALLHKDIVMDVIVSSNIDVAAVFDIVAAAVAAVGPDGGGGGGVAVAVNAAEVRQGNALDGHG